MTLLFDAGGRSLTRDLDPGLEQLHHVLERGPATYSAPDQPVCCRCLPGASSTSKRPLSPPCPGGSDRLSVAFFFGANLDATVPLLKLAPEYAVNARGLTQDPHNPLFRHVGQNYLKAGCARTRTWPAPTMPIF